MPLRVTLMLILVLFVGCKRKPDAEPAHDGAGKLAASASTWEKDVLQNPKPVLVDFGATWCGPCRQMEPAIHSLAKDFEVRTVDVDNEPELASRYQIRSIPALLIFHKGEIAVRHVGLTPERVLRDELRQLSGS